MKKKSEKILLIESDHFILAMYSLLFSKEGFLVRGALTAQEGLAEAQVFKPDFIITEVALPDEDGLSLLKKIKAHKGLADTPIILLSNLSHPTYREQALIHGAIDYIVKAYFYPHEVIEKIKNYFS